MTTSSVSPQDEKLMSALSHGSILLPTTGIVVPIIVWATQREKSHFIAFHALQAMALHILMIVGGMFGVGCNLLSMFLIPIVGTASAPDAAFPLFFFLSFGSLGLIFLGWSLLVFIGLVAAFSVLQGKNFRYPLIGNWVDRFLENP